MSESMWIYNWLNISTHRSVGLFLSNMDPPFIDVHTAYYIEEIVCYRYASVLKNLRPNSYVIVVRIQGIHTLRAKTKSHETKE